jgi:hypothetical protein
LPFRIPKYDFKKTVDNDEFLRSRNTRLTPKEPDKIIVYIF